MKKIPEPDLTDAIILKPIELNKIHFAGNHTPLTPEKIKEIAEKAASRDPADKSIKKHSEAPC